MKRKGKEAFVAFEHMSAMELWEHNRLEYASVNPISRYLYDTFYRDLKVLLLPNVTGGARMLEVGCGCGESSLRIHAMLSEARPDVHFEASEFDSRFVEVIGTMEYPFRVTQESVYEMNRASGSLDMVLLLEVLEHLENPEKAISELFRVSKQYVVISVPNEPIWRMANMARGKYLGQWGNTPGHINHFNETSLRELVRPYGKVKAVRKPFPWLMMLFEKNG